MISTGVRRALSIAGTGTIGAGLAIFCAAFAQTGASGPDSPWIRPGYYKTLKPDKLKSVVTQMVTRDVENPPSSEGVMFAGSSTIAEWDLKQYFPQYRTINRGIPSSLISETTWYADQLIAPFKPSTLVFGSGDNDIAYGMTPDMVATDFGKFLKKIHEASPRTQIVALAIRPTIARLAVWDSARAANEKIKEIAGQDKQTQFVDLAEVLLAPDGKPDRELLGDDLQHLNKQGFDLISPVVRIAIRQAESLYWRGFNPPRSQ